VRAGRKCARRNGAPTAQPDVIDRAIATAAPPTITAQIALLNRRDRVAALSIPADITDLEWLGLVGAILQIGDQLRARRPSSRLVVPQ